mgnify:CR=1 FL=1
MMQKDVNTDEFPPRDRNGEKMPSPQVTRAGFHQSCAGEMFLIHFVFSGPSERFPGSVSAGNGPGDFHSPPSCAVFESYPIPSGCRRTVFKSRSGPGIPVQEV